MSRSSKLPGGGLAPVLPATGLYSYHNDSPPFSGATNLTEPEPMSLDGNGNGMTSPEGSSIAQPHHHHSGWTRNSGNSNGASKASSVASEGRNGEMEGNIAVPIGQSRSRATSPSRAGLVGTVNSGQAVSPSQADVASSSNETLASTRPGMNRVQTSVEDVSLSSSRSRRLVSGYMFGNPEPSLPGRRDSSSTIRRSDTHNSKEKPLSQEDSSVTDGADQDLSMSMSASSIIGDDEPDLRSPASSPGTSLPANGQLTRNGPSPSGYDNPTGYEDALNGVLDGEADADSKAMQAVGGSSERYMRGDEGEAGQYVFPTHRLRTRMKDENKIPVVIVACGSFSPPTYLHLRMFEMAKDEIVESQTFEIMAGYYSPVSSYYKKSGLAPAYHRVRMCELAVEHTSTWLMVDPWEAGQPEYQRTAVVLDHFDEMLNGKDGQGGVEMSDGTRRKVKVMLLAGGDLIESFGEPGVWSEPDLHIILGRFGCLIVERAGSDVWAFLLSHDILYHHRRNVIVIKQLIYNDISSTKVRLFVRRGMSIKYLLPNSVIQYIRENRLYLEPDTKAIQA